MTWSTSGSLISAGPDQWIKTWNWDAANGLLRDNVKLHIRGNVRQILPLPSDKENPYLDHFVMLREGSFAVEKLSLQLSREYHN